MSDGETAVESNMEVESAGGLTNGHMNGGDDHHSSSSSHKSKDKHRDRDKDKDRHKSSHKDKDRDKERSRDKDRHSSSHKSSHRDRDKDRHSSSHKSSHKDKDKDRERSDKDRERSDKDRHRDKDRHSSSHKSSHKDKDKDRHRDKDKEKSKDRHRDDKDRKSSSHDKKDRDRHSSSHKSSHKDKHRDRDKEKSKDHRKIMEDLVKMEAEEMEVKKELNDSYEEFKPDVKVKKEEEDDKSKVFDQDVEMKEEASEEEEDKKLVIVKEELLEDEEEEEAQEEEEEEYQPEEEDEDEVPLAKHRPSYKEEDSEDDKPLAKTKRESKSKAKKRKYEESDYEDEDFEEVKKKKKAKKEKVKKEEKRKSVPETPVSPTKGGKKKKVSEEEQNVWKWWEEEKKDDGVKWKFLEHKGPYFAEPYEKIPESVKFYYDGKHIKLSEEAEEVAGFYARMLDHDYTSKEIFNKNFFRDWRKCMTSKEQEIITSLKKCDFRKMHAYFLQCNEERKNRTKEEKKALKEKNEALVKEYGWCNIDGHKQRIGNFKIEPPGLFRGRGEHPKMGMLKKRIVPEDVIINCSKDSERPQPPPGRKWKEVRHDNTVTWLANWVENVQGQGKYVMLNAASKLKGEKDWQKYETARKLHKCVDVIRENYINDFKSKEMRVRQRAVALYFIDKLALRAGNEKDEDQADTVGCCSLRYEHITLHPELNGKEYVVVFDFLGKDSIRYYNEVPVEKKVYKNLTLFMENKQAGDDLFDRLNTQIMNQHLNSLMSGLTAKVFRTYNASRTLQEQLMKMTDEDDPVPAKVLSYNRANREVAILCNHQRAVPKTHDQSMANLQKKIDDKKSAIKDAEADSKQAKKEAKHGGSAAEKMKYEKKKKAVERLKEQLTKLEIQATDKEENKQIALGTSKLNYLDPRISVAWCKKYEVPIEKVYNKTQRLKFQWAIDMAGPEYNFMNDPNETSRAGNEDDEEEEEEEEDYE